MSGCLGLPAEITEARSTFRDARPFHQHVCGMCALCASLPKGRSSDDLTGGNCRLQQAIPFNFEESDLLFLQLEMETQLIAVFPLQHSEDCRRMGFWHTVTRAVW